MSRLTISDNNLTYNLQKHAITVHPEYYYNAGANYSKIIHNNDNDLHTTTVWYDNGITVETNSDGVIINSMNGFIKLESKGKTIFNIFPEITFHNNCEDPVTELIIDRAASPANSPLIFNNHNSSLEKITINTNTIFNNFNAAGKGVLKGNNLEQTNFDLPIKELKLELGSEIKFTHYGQNYKFANPKSAQFNIENIAKSL